MTDISLFEAIYTQRAIRRFTTDPVPDEAITSILEAAIRGPSGGNRQPWYFLVIRDREAKRRLGQWYRNAWSSWMDSVPSEVASEQPYRLSSQEMLTYHMEDVPGLIMACLERGSGKARSAPITRGAHIYPAVQNLMLAARALGLGTVLTSLHTFYEQEVKEFLGIPDGVETAALIPVGYPAEGERFSKGKRRPVQEVTFYERWGQKGGG